MFIWTHRDTILLWVLLQKRLITFYFTCRKNVFNSKWSLRFREEPVVWKCGWVSFFLLRGRAGQTILQQTRTIIGFFGVICLTVAWLFWSLPILLILSWVQNEMRFRTLKAFHSHQLQTLCNSSYTHVHLCWNGLVIKNYSRLRRRKRQRKNGMLKEFIFSLVFRSLFLTQKENQGFSKWAILFGADASG